MFTIHEDTNQDHYTAARNAIAANPLATCEHGFRLALCRRCQPPEYQEQTDGERRLAEHLTTLRALARQEPTCPDCGGPIDDGECHAPTCPTTGP